MKKISSIFIFIIIFMIISILMIYSSTIYLDEVFKYIYLKQLLYYLLGFIIIFIIMYLKNKYILNFTVYFYIFINILLLITLVFAPVINGSRCWLMIGPFSFQPSELMKIAIILMLANIITKHKENGDQSDLILIKKTFLVVLIPSILVFLEPDTGNVIIYFLILLSSLLISGLNKKIIITSCISIFTIFIIFISLYLFNKNLLINIFSSDIIYRIERIISWQNKSGMQLENSLVAIGSSYLFGHGYMHNPIYLIESSTDFIFSVLASNFGLIGSGLFLILILLFDLKLLSVALNNKKLTNKIIVIGSFVAILFPQIQNIAMTMGLLPITGIPLPFISYGGTNILTLMILMGLIINIEKASAY
ncbi:MAG: FtsW/RodA/SpoVE family cell cycle protein [Bacilli bacterium]